MQLFVSDKVYVLVVPMHSASEFPNALQLFTEEVGVPMHLIAEPNPSQKSNEVQQFYHKIGTTLCLLEESTQWAS